MHAMLETSSLSAIMRRLSNALWHFATMNCWISLQVPTRHTPEERDEASNNREHC